jgi:alanine racemase
LLPETYFNLVRIGIAIYGIWPSDTVHRAVEKKVPSLHLKPVLTWKTVVAQIKTVTKGTAVGYGFSERVARDTVIAVLPVGYWDGYGRYQSSKGHVLIRGRRCKVVGRICMNMCMVDVTDVPGIRVEDEVILLGRKGKESVPAEEIADHADSIAYEIVTRINPLIPRMIR